MALVLMAISVTYGFGIECYQLVYVKGRSFDVYDGLADSIGAALGWLCIKLYR
jgi:VanZ family protein